MVLIGWGHFCEWIWKDKYIKSKGHPYLLFLAAQISLYEAPFPLQEIIILLVYLKRVC